MKNCICALIVLSMPLSTSLSQNKEKSRIGIFAAAVAGSFEIEFPESAPTSEIAGEAVGFSDIYGTKNGPSYGFEGGLGINNIYGVFKYRVWDKVGDPKVIEIIGQTDFTGDIEWSQEFAAFGLRLFLIDPLNSKEVILPFIGGGFIQSRVNERMRGEFSSGGFSDYVDVEADLDGTGFYLEGGIDLFINPYFSLRGIAEYSSVKLGISVENVRIEIEGGGGVFVGGGLSVFIK